MAKSIVLSPSPLTPATATVGVPYNGGTGVTFSTTGGVSGATYTYLLSDGAIPAGMTLTPAGLLSGTPAQSGSFVFTVTASDSTDKLSGSQSYTLTVSAPTIMLSPTTLSAGVNGTPYSAAITASGGPEFFSERVGIAVLQLRYTETVHSSGFFLSGVPGDRSSSLGWSPGSPATGLRRWGGSKSHLAQRWQGRMNWRTALTATHLGARAVGLFYPRIS